LSQGRAGYAIAIHQKTKKKKTAKCSQVFGLVNEKRNLIGWQVDDGNSLIDSDIQAPCARTEHFMAFHYFAAAH